MKTMTFVFALALIAGCSSSDPYDRERERPRPQRMNRAARIAETDLLPPPRWWHDYVIAQPLELTNEQMQQLDRAAADFGQDEIARLQRDSLVAVRDLRTVLDSDKPTSDDILAAGKRLRSLRDEISDREFRLLAAERQILTRDQWQKLQEQLREERIPRDRMNDSRRRGSGGGFGGRGRGRRPG